ncbi:hypothetical protein X975_21853, partial [Stegodyphus mimosarum]
MFEFLLLNFSLVAAFLASFVTFHLLLFFPFLFSHVVF